MILLTQDYRGIKKSLIVALLSVCAISCGRSKLQGTYAKITNSGRSYISEEVSLEPSKKYYIVLTGNLTKECLLNDNIAIDIIGSEKNSIVVSKEKFFGCNWGPPKARFENNLHKNIAVEIPLSEIQKVMLSDSKKKNFHLVIHGGFLVEKIHSIDLFIHN